VNESQVSCMMVRDHAVRAAPMVPEVTSLVLLGPLKDVGKGLADLFKGFTVHFLWPVRCFGANPV